MDTGCTIDLRSAWIDLLKDETGLTEEEIDEASEQIMADESMTPDPGA